MLTPEPTTTTKLVLQLSIELPATPAAVNALAEVLGAVIDLPGTILSSDNATARLTELVPRLSIQDRLVERLHIDPRSRQVCLRGAPVDLTRLEFDLLLYMSTRPNLVHRRSTLLSQVWDIAEPYTSRTVDVHIRRLRDKLGSFGRLIHTVRGVGYRFERTHLVVVEQAAHT